MKMLKKKYKYAIIGMGAMGNEHYQNLQLLENVEVVAICDNYDKSLQNFSKSNNEKIKIFNNHLDLISENPADVYIIATPNHTHLNLLKDLIKTNSHLMIEKPLCTNVKDCFDLKRWTSNYSGMIWTAMEYRYMPPVKKFISDIKLGKIGEIKMLSIREHRFPFLKKVRDWNRFEKNTGGTLVEKCCHFFDLMRLILESEAVRVYASGNQDVNHLDEKYDERVPDILDNAYVVIDFENGTRALLELCMFAENSKLQEEICGLGDKGKIFTGVPSHQSGRNSSELTIGLRKNDKVISETISVDQRILKAGHHHGSTYFEHVAFINAINNNFVAEVSLDDGLKAVAIGQAAEISIKEKRIVFMNELI